MESMDYFLEKYPYNYCGVVSSPNPPDYVRCPMIRDHGMEVAEPREQGPDRYAVCQICAFFHDGIPSVIYKCLDTNSKTYAHYTYDGFKDRKACSIS